MEASGTLGQQLAEASDLSSVRRILRQIAESSSPDVARQACVVCANHVVRAWAPLFAAAERAWWLSVFVAALPSSIAVLFDALCAATLPEDAALVCCALEAALSAASPPHLLSSDLTVRMLCSLPDRCANQAQLLVPAFFEPARFFAWLAVRAGAVEDPPSLQHLVTCMVGLGQTAALARAWAALPERHLADVVGPCVARTPRGEKLVPHLLAFFSTARFFAVVGPLLEHPSLCHVLECDLLAMRVLPSAQARVLVSVHCMRGAAVAQRLAGELAAIWSDSHFARHAPEELQLQVTRAIRYLLDSCDAAATRDVMPALLGGVHERLGLPDAGRRHLGMALAQRASRSLEGVQPLKFEEVQGLDELLDWDPVSVEPETPEATDHDVSSSGVGKIVVDDPAARVRSLFDDDDDDDESLSSYEMEDEVVGGGERRPPGPAYLRDCLQCLIDGKRKADQQERGLLAVEGLVRGRPADLEDVCIPLTSALLHAANEFDLPDFDGLRLGGLVSLAVHAPVRVVEHLGAQFCAPNWSIVQRLTMLDAVHRAAVELSGGEPVERAVPVVVVAPAVSADGRSRRWGSALHPAAAAAGGGSRLLTPVVGSFFWPFQNGLRSSFAMTLDFVVLARLVLYLGKIVSLAPWGDGKRRMLEALLEGVWVHRWHRQAHVGRSCMMGLVEALLSLPPDRLVDEWADDVSEVIGWYSDAARDAVDRETAEVASACAAELARHVQRATGQDEHEAHN